MKLYPIICVVLLLALQTSAKTHKKKVKSHHKKSREFPVPFLSRKATSPLWTKLSTLPPFSKPRAATASTACANSKTSSIADSSAALKSKSFLNKLMSTKVLFWIRQCGHRYRVGRILHELRGTFPELRQGWELFVESCRNDWMPQSRYVIILNLNFSILINWIILNNLLSNSNINL